MEHEKQDREKIINVPIMVLWGNDGKLNRFFDVLSAWRERAANVTGFGVPHCGHYIPEEAPEVILNSIKEFMYP
ncbi:alpha/beta fold hydrolase [Sporomusa rhizae]|uniref:alpha/beta fold hydrolase n=1 Tax=Sporomusa rhizae TaxID=357999 RepID=UPI00352A8DC4